MGEFGQLTPEMIGALITPLALFFALIGTAIASFVPALLYWILMPVLFRHSVRFLPILGILALFGLLGYFLILVLLTLAPETAEILLSEDENIITALAWFGATLVLFLIQSTALSFAVWDSNGAIISVGKWIVVALMQVVLIVVLSVIIAWSMSG